MQSHKARDLFTPKKILAMIVIVIIAAVLLFSFASNSQIRITAVNMNVSYNCGGNDCIQFDGNWFGSIQGTGNSFPVPFGSHFTETITPTNQDCCNPHPISSISSLTSGFAVISTSPALPVTLNPGESLKISIQIQVPNHPYTGPIDFQVITS